MRPLPLALGAATVVAFAAIIGVAVYSEVFQDLPSLLLDADLMTKAAVVLLFATLGRAALLPNRLGEANRSLNIIAILAIGLGLLAATVATGRAGKRPAST
ncbi:MAG: hypothetical protein Q7T61_04950 [Caulobacter sp.]|nr:hypothetical protein [Caulobacter sp.]